MSAAAFLIINPTSGSYSAARVERAVALLAERGIRVELRLTGTAGDAERFAREACTACREPLVIAGGGDGTVNEVLNGLLPGAATLAVLPLGTSNVLARELGIRSPEDAVARIARGTSRPLTVGLAKKGEVRRYFLLMAGAGVDGAVVEGMRGTEKRLFGKGAYILSVLRLLVAWKHERFEVNAAGQRLRCHSVIVCNAANYGGSFRLAPAADIFSPTLEVLCVESNRRRDYLRLLGGVIAGRGSGRSATVISAREVEIHGGMAMQLDGDYFCRAPVTISAQENFVRLIV